MRSLIYYAQQAWKVFILLSIVAAVVLAAFVMFDLDPPLYTIPERLIGFVVLWVALAQLEELSK